AADDEAGVAAHGAGAAGVLSREAKPTQIARALAAAHAGLLVFDRSLAATLPPRRHPSAPADTLTARELEVLQLLAEGLPNKLIADRLRVSEHTAKFHVNAILGKLGAQSRTEAVVRAARLGLVLL
ncbi:MAG: response regulator transcription factor, partial [Myxococcales bacterium]